MNKRWTGIVAFSIALCGAWSASASGKTIDREFHETFEVSPGARLELIHGDGDVDIKPWDRNVIDVHVRYRAEVKGGRTGSDPDFEVEFDQSGQTVSVRGREIGGKGIGILFNQEHEYTYTIQAPPYVVLATDGDDGKVTIDGWRADVEVTLGDGDLAMSDVEAGAIRIELEDGDAEIDRLTGALNVQIDDGDVTVTECDSSRIDIRAQDGQVTLDRCRGNFEIVVDDGDASIRRASASKASMRAEDGNIDLDLESATGPLDLSIQADDGNVSVELGAGISASFSIETDDGGIGVAAAEWVQTKSDHRVTGEIGDGSGRIRIVTNDGNVSLR